MSVFRGSFTYPLRGISVTKGLEKGVSMLSGTLRFYIVGIAAEISSLRPIAGERWRFEWFSGVIYVPLRGISQTEGSEPDGSLLSGKLRPYIVGIAAEISILRSIAGELWRFE